MTKIEQVIFYSLSAQQLGKHFRASLATDSGQFIEKPTELDKSRTGLRLTLLAIKELREKFVRELDRRSTAFLELGADKLTASDLAVKSMRVQSQLEQTGGIYGDNAVNFCLTQLVLTKEQLVGVETAALAGFKTVTSLLDETPGPNGARVDIILTDAGPRIIEVNTLWVDGFQILESLNAVYGGRYKAPTQVLGKYFKAKTITRLGIVLINSATGSRKTGETKSLIYMAEQLRKRNLFSEVEVLDPKKTRPEYMAGFPYLYIDGDPRMLTDTPTWVQELTRRDPRSVFPLWCPNYESKKLLIPASNDRPDLFAKTFPFSTPMAPNMFLKGDLFSSRQVATTGSNDYEGVLTDAQLFPNEYVLQERQQATQLASKWVFNTSSSSPSLLKSPKCKYNVWIVGDKIAGITASLSEGEIISDADYNCIPITV